MSIVTPTFYKMHSLAIILAGLKPRPRRAMRHLNLARTCDAQALDIYIASIYSMLARCFMFVINPRRACAARVTIL